jgi:hypothetical protein
MNANLHDIAVAMSGFLLATAAASMLPAASLAAALRSRTLAYRASRRGPSAA